MLENIDLPHYHMATLEQYKQDFPGLSAVDAELEWLETFLIRTDYQVVKAAEFQLAGQPVPDEIRGIIAARQDARARINELEAGEKND